MVPHAAGGQQTSRPHQPQHVVFEWNTRLEAARLVAQSLRDFEDRMTAMFDHTWSYVTDNILPDRSSPKITMDDFFKRKKVENDRRSQRRDRDDDTASSSSSSPAQMTDAEQQADKMRDCISKMNRRFFNKNVYYPYTTSENFRAVLQDMLHLVQQAPPQGYLKPVYFERRALEEAERAREEAKRELGRKRRAPSSRTGASSRTGKSSSRTGGAAVVSESAGPTASGAGSGPADRW